MRLDEIPSNSCTLLGIYEYKFNTLTHKKMIKVLFKSEELLIAADSESKVVYGNTRRNSAVKYLNELTPKSSERYNVDYTHSFE